MSHKQKRRPARGGESVVEQAGKQFDTENSKSSLQLQTLEPEIHTASDALAEAYDNIDWIDWPPAQGAPA